MSAGHHNAPSAFQRKGAFLRTVRAVAWAFLGLRKGSEHQQDSEKINPLHLILVSILAFLVLVLSLIALVNWVV